MKPRLLDLFACEGGASAGYQAAGFHVTAVDLNAKALERNPADVTVKMDVMEYLSIVDIRASFDAVHASPPCQDHSALASRAGLHGTGHLLADTLDALAKLDVPWAVENVAGADMPGALTLCGTEFDLSVVCKDGKRRWLKRHRQFLSNIDLWGAGGCSCSQRPIAGVYGHGGGGQMGRGYKSVRDEARDLLRVPWMSQYGASQCIPPAYAKHIGEQLMSYVKERAA